MFLKLLLESNLYWKISKIGTQSTLTLMVDPKHFIVAFIRNTVVFPLKLAISFLVHVKKMISTKGLIVICYY
jgi:hypothetical protein